MNRTLRNRAALFGVLLLAALPAAPEQLPARYTIEVVVFRTADAVAGDTPGKSEPVDAPPATELEVATFTGRRLGSAVNKLRATPGFRVLAHTAWSQVPAALNSHVGVSAAQLNLGAGISGNIIVERGQFLHLGFDLRIDDGGQSYRVNEVRNVKLEKAQYFDHPAVGIIAVVTAGDPGSTAR